MKTTITEADRAIRRHAETMTETGMSSAPGWTNLEVKRALQRIGAGMSVSNSEYQVAMSAFRARNS